MSCRRCFLILFSFLCLMSAHALCASVPSAVPLADAHAVVLHADNQSILIGCSDPSAVHDADALCAVVKICDHEEHCGGVEALAAQHGIPVLSPGDALPVSNSSWENAELIVSLREGTVYTFGAEKARETAISYRCDGTLIPFSGSTNEAAVNVRDKPSTKGGRVAKLQRGQTVTVLSLLLESGEYWYEVQLSDGKTGYIRSDLLSAHGVIEETPEPSSNASETRYIGNKNSKVFHRPSCGHLPSSKNIVYLDSRDYAVAKGYRPCSYCEP